MLNDDGLRRFYVDLLGQAEIEAGGKTFKIVDVERRGEEIFFKVYCTEFDPNNTTEINAMAGERRYLEAYQQLKQQARRQPRRPAETEEVEGELKKIKPELKFAYDAKYARKGIGIVGKAFYVNPKKYGITKDNVDRVYGKVLELEDKIMKLKIGPIIRNIKLKPEDADVSNPCLVLCVAHKMNITQLIKWEKQIHSGLSKIWQRQDFPPKRIKRQIEMLKGTNKIYDRILGKKGGFKKEDDARLLYEGLRLLPDEKKRKVFKIKGRITKATMTEINRKIHHYQKQDEVWEYYWDCLVASIYLINKLIQRINQAIGPQGKEVQQQRRG